MSHGPSKKKRRTLKLLLDVRYIFNPFAVAFIDPKEYSAPFNCIGIYFNPFGTSMTTFQNEVNFYVPHYSHNVKFELNYCVKIKIGSSF